MRILQISDFHLRGDGQLSFQVVDTRKCLEVAQKHLRHVFDQANQKPDVIVITGDLADSGDEHAYRLLYEALSEFPVPIYALPGNHDRRDRMRALLPGWTIENEEVSPYLCYSVEHQDVRLVMFDSMQPGSHSGHVPPKAIEWLERELQHHPNQPTLLFMHHPPFQTGMGAMDEPYENVAALETVLKKSPWVRLCCGHMHRPITTMWAGVACVTAPAASMQIELDFSIPGGDTFRMETPGYLLHDLENGQWNTHVCQIYTQAGFDGPYPFVGKVNPIEN